MRAIVTRSSVSFVMGDMRDGAFVASLSGVFTDDDWSRRAFCCSPSANDGFNAAVGDWNNRAVAVAVGVSSYRLL